MNTLIDKWANWLASKLSYKQLSLLFATLTFILGVLVGLNIAGAVALAK